MKELWTHLKGCLLAAVFSLALYMGTIAYFESSLAAQPQERKPEKLHIVINLIWEGRHLRPENLDAIHQLRSEFPFLEWNQFINPLYFLKAIPNAKNDLRSVLKDRDQFGVHFHLEPQLVKSAGVRFLKFPSMLSEKQKFCQQDCGYDVPLTAYTPQDVRKITDKAIEILHRQGFQRTQAFLAPGWVIDKKSLEAIAKGRSLNDYSRVPPQILPSTFEQMPLGNMIRKLYRGIHVTTPPSRSEPNLIRFTNNSLALDYLTLHDLKQIYHELVRELSTTKEDQYFFLSLYQETLAEQIPKLKKILGVVKGHSQRQHVHVANQSFHRRNNVRR